jgi:hypothetical protein
MFHVYSHCRENIKYSKYSYCQCVLRSGEVESLSLSELRGHFKLVPIHLSGTRFLCIWHLFLMVVFCFHLLLMIYIPFELFSSPVKSRFLYSYHRPFYRCAIASFLSAFCSYICLSSTFQYFLLAWTFSTLFSLVSCFMVQRFKFNHKTSKFFWLIPQQREALRTVL